MRHSDTSRSCPRKQSGAVFIVMLVIMVMGAATLLVSALSSSALKTKRDEVTADALAQAKEVVIGYMLQGHNIPPGMMQPPDVLSNPMSTELRPDGTQGSNYDGEWDTGCFNINNGGNTPPYTPLTITPANMRCLGRLPWKSLGMSISNPSENDPLGVMPWYAFSSNLMNASLPINSELLNITTNWLTVRDMSGNVLSNRVAFLIIIPGPPLQGQARPSSPNLQGPSEYLDSITIPNPCTTPCVSGTYSNFDFASHDPFINGFIMGAEHRWIDDPANPGKQIDDPAYHFNDKLLYVTIDELMPLIEKRIAREVKTCLDDYAAISANKYPWAVPVTDTTNYLSASNTRFGRLPLRPNLFSADPDVIAFVDALTALQTALNTYAAASPMTTAVRTALKNAGNTLENLADPPAPSIPSGAASNGKTAGDLAQDLAKSPPQSTVAAVQSAITATRNALISGGLIDSDTSMSMMWPSSCTLFSPANTYWSDWRNLVFYQVADGYQPSSSASCTAGTTCLTINGSGNTSGGNGVYHASVIVAGKMLAGQNPRNPTATPPATYLEGVNPHNPATPAVTFETYNSSDAQYSTVNDLVLCLDGKNNCK